MNSSPAFSFDMSFCGAPPTLEALWGRWNADPYLLALLILLAAVAAWMLASAGRGRQAAFAGAWTVAVILYVSPFCALTVALLSARIGHHILLTMVVAPLLALALPSVWGRRAGLLPALIVSTVSLWVWHTPDLYAAAFSHPAIYWAMQLSLLGSFTWLWLGLLRADNGMGAGLTALGGAVQMGFLGALLVFASRPLYLPHLGTTLSFGLTPLEDQQLGGLIMWVPANLPLLAVVLRRLATSLQPEARSAVR